MTSLRKLLFVILAVLLVAVCAVALADTDYSLSPAPMKVTLRDNRTVVTAQTLGEHPELLTVIGMSKEDTLADWAARGVVLQAWSAIDQKTWNASKSKYTCLEICVLQDSAASQYRDLMQDPSNKEGWREYIASYKGSSEWNSLGYTFQAQDKDQYHADSNYYLLLKYKRSFDGGNYRGYMARTVWKGYTLVFDMKVYNQLPTDTQANEIYRVIRTLADSGDAGLPAVSGSGVEGSESGEIPEGGETPDGTGSAGSSASAQLDISVRPPRETNTSTFTIEGTTVPGAQVIGVLMKNVNYSKPFQFTTTSHEKNGTFKLKVTIPEDDENVWLVTLNVYEGPDFTNLVAEKVFDTTTYKKTLIPFELDSEVPGECYSDELTIAGTTMKAVDVQCIATDSSGRTIVDKKSHPNGTGRFTFRIPMKEEGIYDIALIVTKKGFDTKRFTYSVSRFLTDEARQAQIRKTAARVGYGALSSRVDQYVGKTLSFSVWITGIDQIGDEWRVLAAGSKTGDHYSQRLVFMTGEEPPFALEEKHTLYGMCKGLYEYQSEEDPESYPLLDLLLWD